MAPRLPLKCSGVSPEGFAVHSGEPPSWPLEEAICTLAGLRFPMTLRGSVCLVVSRLLHCMQYHHQQHNHRDGSTSRRFGVTVPFGMSPIATNIQVCDKSF